MFSNYRSYGRNRRKPFWFEVNVSPKMTNAYSKLIAWPSLMSKLSFCAGTVNVHCRSKRFLAAAIHKKIIIYDIASASSDLVCVFISCILF